MRIMQGKLKDTKQVSVWKIVSAKRVSRNFLTAAMVVTKVSASIVPIITNGTLTVNGLMCRM